MKCSALSDLGKNRKNNEDSFYCKDGSNLFIVADGLGGHSAGEIASDMATQYVVNKNPQDLEELLNAVTEANSHVYNEAKKLKNDMATTISAMLIKNGKAYIAHVGDSRIYLIRGETVYRLTDDHTPVMESLRSGLITEEQARYHPLKHMLSRTIGTHNQVEVDILQIDIEENDFFIMCTDGLSNVVSEYDMYDIFLNEQDINKIPKNLVDLANFRGGPDNITVVCVKIEAEDLVL
ncbi:MAG: protein-serine/threonine phosphatase [Candidatus Sericytochromatia bacterium]|nr:MAG: protein-serine/threonine phosphatase [Candidatus Sericytochromatia bacterium]